MKTAWARFQEKENGKSLNTVSLQHVGKRALMVATVAFLQGAAGVEMEPNEQQQLCLSERAFADLALVSCIILAVQSLMLWLLLRHFLVSGV